MKSITTTTAINKEVPPTKSLKPIYTNKANLKAEWTYNSQDNIYGYGDPISKTKMEIPGMAPVLGRPKKREF